jgi:hypothetical protein
MWPIDGRVVLRIAGRRVLHGGDFLPPREPGIYAAHIDGSGEFVQWREMYHSFAGRARTGAAAASQKLDVYLIF